MTVAEITRKTTAPRLPTHCPSLAHRSGGSAELGQKSQWDFGSEGPCRPSEDTARVLPPFFLYSLRTGSDIQDYSLTGCVWSTVTPSPEHLGDEVNLKVTVLCDSLREPLTFTCNCELVGVTPVSLELRQGGLFGNFVSHLTLSPE